MNPSLRTLGLVTAVLLALGTAGLAIGDSDDDDDDDHDDRRGGWIKPGKDVQPVSNAVYAEECGACHMAYQPGLLPSAAWQQIMSIDALADHYGDDASLSDSVRLELADYLNANSADKASRSRSRAFSVGDAGTGPLPRITATRYFRNEHDEIPARMVVDNAEVGSFSNCNACHQGAAEGVYNEHRVRIPGFPGWED
jgi:mono/diheme cytochrome c family protein